MKDEGRSITGLGGADAGRRVKEFGEASEGEDIERRQGKKNHQYWQCQCKNIKDFGKACEVKNIKGLYGANKGKAIEGFGGANIGKIIKGFGGPMKTRV